MTHEVGNIKKCLHDEFDTVVIVSDSDSHLENIQKRITENLEQDLQDKVVYLKPADFVDYFDQHKPTESTKTKTVKGYKVSVTKKKLSPEEQEKRQDAIAQVIASSMKKVQ